MALEGTRPMRRSTYVKAGLLLLVAGVFVTAACVFLGAGLFSRHALFETYIEKDGRGIGPGAPVSYRGVRIGQVESATLCWTAYRGRIPDTPEGLRAARYARIVFSIDNAFFGHGDFSADEVVDEVRDGMRLTVKDMGATGAVSLDLDFYEPAPAPLPVPWESKHPYIPCASGLSLSVADAVRDISRNLGAFGALASNVNGFVESAADTLGEGRLSAMGVVDNVERASKSLADALEQIRADPSVLLRQSREKEDSE